MDKALQLKFLDNLTRKFAKKTEAVESIASLLLLGKDAIYRRLRGDSILTPEEMQKLAKEFNISVDQFIFEKTDKVFFSFNSFTNPVSQFDDYLIGVNKNLDTALALPNPKILYTTAEIPSFYYSLFPEMMCFKLYTWGKTIWNFEHLQNQAFSFDLFYPKTLQLIKENIDKYNLLPSTELWCLNIFDNTLNQIEFVLTSGGFEKTKDALFLCDCLIRLADHIQKMATHGKKFGANADPKTAVVPYELYHNELVFTNNTILLTSDLYNAVYSTFDSPNFLTSDDPRIFEHTEIWFHNIKSKSEYITKVSEKHRNIFFNRLKKKVEKTKARIRIFSEQS